MKIKNLIYLMLCICVATLMSGCNGGGADDTTPTPTPVMGTDIGSEVTIIPPENIEVTIYSIDPSSLEKVAIEVLIGEVTPEAIVEEVVSAMRDEAFYIGVNDVVLKDNMVIVDFKADTPPVIDVGASVEGMILDAFGQSILDNLPDCAGVIFRIEGKAYETGHIEMGIDEVYIRR